MKRFLYLFLLAPLLTIAASKTNAFLTCKYPTNDLSPDLFFNFYHATNISTGIANWTVYTNVAYTNMTFSLVATNPKMALLSVPIVILPGMHFFIGTVSNGWCESDPSDLAVTNVPRSGQNFRIEQGP